MKTPWHVYIIKCSDGTYYTGISNNLEKRLLAHNTGRGAAYTKNKGPVSLVYHELHKDRSRASKREYAIKQLSRQKKVALIARYKTHTLLPLSSISDTF